MILELLARRNDDWLRMAKKFSLEPENALQEAYIKMHYRFKDCPEKVEAMDDGQLAMYMYLTIRSAASNTYKLDRRYAELDETQVTRESLPFDSAPYDYEEDAETEKNLKAIKVLMNDWHWYDYKLFNLHIVEGMSMREISRQTGISLSSIFHTIKTCKQNLKDKL